MATPVATACAIAAAARAQVLIKSGGVALDRLAALNTLGLDKTGTLTEGSFRVTDVYMVPGERLQEVPWLCAAAEPLDGPVYASTRRWRGRRGRRGRRVKVKVKCSGAHRTPA